MNENIRKLFGTDGIRGIANEELTPELALKTGKAAARFLIKDSEGRKAKILIGKDSRPSGDFLEASIAAGILSSGADVYMAGILSTPAIAMLTKMLEMDGGIVISASHNPLEDNGIKIFKKGGEKLSDEQEKLIEDFILDSDTADKNITKSVPIGLEVGRIKNLNNSINIYIKHIIKNFSFNLNKLKVAVDCANGAMSIIVPKVLKMSGADVISYNTDFESGLINNNCGSTHPEVLKNIVLQSRADIGFSYDGDGDRVIGCDSKGRIFDGDVIMAFCAINMKNENILKNNSVVTTIMANYGFEKAMQENNIKVYKTNVGDRYVLEKMIETDSVLGGEQSGHIIFKNFSHIGDGLVSTLIFLEYINKTQIKINEIYDIIEHYPQLLKNLKVKNKNEIMQSNKLKQKISEAQNKLEGEGKVVVRSSGTEPLIRIMVEAKTLELATEIQEEICNFIYELK
ncbi:MAG: phosphoglucosamine mutase [Actinobacteria bacterium]|nr:phosphoglucosamine mutase [Cyanobacteriota bacterium]MCL5770823.1 phosphoglucosamine mutase [Actinomycetota bacterium]